MNPLSELSRDVFFLLVVILAVMPIIDAWSVYNIGKVWFSDESRPRNQVLRRVMWSGISLTASSFFVAALCVGWLRGVIFGHAPIAFADGTTVLFAVVLIVTFMQPFLNWRNLVGINDSRTGILGGKPETQNQREDRQFGTVRRALEIEHQEDNNSQ